MVAAVTASTAAPAAAVRLRLWQALIIETVIKEPIVLVLRKTVTPANWVLDQRRCAYIVACEQRNARAYLIIKPLVPSTSIVWRRDQNVRNEGIWGQSVRNVQSVSRLLEIRARITNEIDFCRLLSPCPWFNLADFSPNSWSKLIELSPCAWIKLLDFSENPWINLLDFDCCCSKSESKNCCNSSHLLLYSLVIPDKLLIYRLYIWLSGIRFLIRNQTNR